MSEEEDAGEPDKRVILDLTHVRQVFKHQFQQGFVGVPKEVAFQSPSNNHMDTSQDAYFIVTDADEMESKMTNFKKEGAHFNERTKCTINVKGSDFFYVALLGGDGEDTQDVRGMRFGVGGWMGIPLQIILISRAVHCNVAKSSSSREQYIAMLRPEVAAPQGGGGEGGDGGGGGGGGQKVRDGINHSSSSSTNTNNTKSSNHMCYVFLDSQLQVMSGRICSGCDQSKQKTAFSNNQWTKRPTTLHDAKSASKLLQPLPMMMRANW
jgi:hypothetical protein